MYKICSLAVAGLVAGWLTLATPAVSQAQVGVSVGIGGGPVVYGGSCYRPGYSYGRHYRNGRVVVGYYAPRPVIVQPAPVYLQPAPVYVQPAPVIAQPCSPYGSPYASPAPVAVQQRGYYPAPY